MTQANHQATTYNYRDSKKIVITILGELSSEAKPVTNLTFAGHNERIKWKRKKTILMGLFFLGVQQVNPRGLPGQMNG